MKSKSIVGNKAYAFAIDIVSLYKNLSTEKKEFILSKQILKSGTSIGANIQEGLSGESKKDFIHKLNIALKEAKETQYWLNLLKDTDYIDNSSFNVLNDKIVELIKLLSRIILTTIKENLNSKL